MTWEADDEVPAMRWNWPDTEPRSSAKEASFVRRLQRRPLIETFKGLDIVPPRFATIVEYDDVPLITSNMRGREELVDYIELTKEGLLTGSKMTAVCVPARMSPQESFLMSMRVTRGKQTLEPEELAGLVRSYMIGYLDALVQFAGIKVAQQVGRDHSYMANPDWQPGVEWQYWEMADQTRFGGPIG